MTHLLNNRGGIGQYPYSEPIELLEAIDLPPALTNWPATLEAIFDYQQQQRRTMQTSGAPGYASTGLSKRSRARRNTKLGAKLAHTGPRIQSHIAVWFSLFECNSAAPPQAKLTDEEMTEYFRLLFPPENRPTSGKFAESAERYRKHLATTLPAPIASTSDIASDNGSGEASRLIPLQAPKQYPRYVRIMRHIAPAHSKRPRPPAGPTLQARTEVVYLANSYNGLLEQLYPPPTKTRVLLPYYAGKYFGFRFENLNSNRRAQRAANKFTLQKKSA
jgi:hypothetical protein